MMSDELKEIKCSYENDIVYGYIKDRQEVEEG